ncbi:MAG TPA: hypothetical protein VF683_06545, partial [Chthoniobacterales bacterium]
VELASPVLQSPHGLDFIDDETLIVTSRGSDVALFELPPGEEVVRTHEVLPIGSWPANAATLLHTPGSVAVSHAGDDGCEVLICNNYAHTVTRHRAASDRTRALKTSEILLRKYLHIPDSVAVSRDRRWIAVSNHSTHDVLLYENSPALNPETKPDGILRGVLYPHGLRFSADGRHLFVADAGAPYLHVYAQDFDEWRGVRDPAASVKIMDDAAFEMGRHIPQSGGPKGLDIDAACRVVVVTSEYQPLAFFDMPALLQHTVAGDAARERTILRFDHELSRMQDEAVTADKLVRLDAMLTSISWRITAPIRRLKSIVSGRQ